MTDNTIATKLEELALLLVMLGDNDSQGMDFVAETMLSLKNDVQADPKLSIIVQSIDFILGLDRQIEGNRFVEDTRRLIASSRMLLQGVATVDFPLGGDAKSDWGSDLGSNADHELIVEFIEKHCSLLDDYEARIMEAVNSAQVDPNFSRVELDGFLKSYLHNIKGDAGSVGLTGVNTVTHMLEDKLLEVTSECLTDVLLAYKEWVLSVCSAYSQGIAPKELSESFIARYLQGSSLKVDSQIEDSISLENITETEPKVIEAVHQVEPVEDKPEQLTFQPVVYTIAGDLEILSEFIVEAEDHLGAIEELLLTPNKSYSLDDLGAIFRAVHSVKGGSAYFSLKEITESSHIMESLMDKARDEKIVFNSVLRELVLEYIGIQRGLLDRVKTALAADGTLETSEVVEVFKWKVNDFLEAVMLVQGVDAIGSISDLLEEAQEITKACSAPVNVVKDSSKAKVEQAVTDLPKVEKPPVKIETSTVSSGKQEEENKVVAVAGNDKVKLKDFVKIETGRLDSLIEYIGEMVISSSMLIKNCRDLLTENDAVIANTHQLERISREIQDIGMSMRLIPIKGLFQKMSRVVWDTAKKLNKDIRFEMEGEDTELDRSVIDKLADPLMHMVRNAVDHGVESPEARLANGKSKQGTVKLTAYHSGGSIYIEISDDGKGLDREKLISKAIEKGLITSGQNLSDEEAYMLIFAAGFSTAETVTDVSGRGVGMDVVRRNIESMRGRVNIKSTIGQGSVFSIELPLTLAIMEGIEIAIGVNHFIVPSLSVVEFLRPSADMIMNTLDKGETLEFRGQFLPIYRVGEIYKMATKYSDPCDGIILVVDVGGKLFALLVDDVVGKLSAVIKSLSTVYQEVEGVSGCAILANGSIGLILDVGTFVDFAQSVADVQPDNNCFLENTQQ